VIRVRAFVVCLLAPLALCTLLAMARPLAAQTYTSMPLDAGFGPIDTSLPDGATPQQIIERFAAKESQFKRALDDYTYQRTVKVDTIGDEDKVDGEYLEVDDIIFNPDGRKTEHVVFAPGSTLTRIIMSPADFSDIEHRLPFVLTQEDIGQYNVTYIGRQKIDELETYAFNVAPKVMEKGKRYFKGRIWVDEHDYQIVVTDGKNVPDDTRPGHEDLSPPFITFRQQIDGQYWFPVYTKGEAVLHFEAGKGYIGQDVHIREIVKYANYKKFGSSIRILYQGQDVTNAGKPAKGSSPTSAPGGSAQPAPAQQPGASAPSAAKPSTTQPSTPQPGASQSNSSDSGAIQPTSTRPETPEPGDSHP
jgi:hypothetical protein